MSINNHASARNITYGYRLMSGGFSKTPNLDVLNKVRQRNGDLPFFASYLSRYDTCYCSIGLSMAWLY